MRAEKAFSLGNFDAALTAYQAAFDAKPLPGFLFNIAQCQRQLGNPRRAIFFYERYLELAPRSSNREAAKALIAEQRARLSEQSATADPPPPPAGPEPPATAIIDVEPPTFRPTPPAPPPSLRAVTGTGPNAPPPGDRPIYRRWWFWTAVAVVSTGAAAALLLRRDGPLPEGGPLGNIDRR
jgi:tetratricopeptide (TPR) repeat protein